jgi:hypothetical protein
VSRFLVIATRSALARAAELGFDGCLEVATERAIAEGGFRRRIPPTMDHEYVIDGGLVVRTKYGRERTAGGRRKFLIVGVERRHDNNARRNER